MSDARFKNVIKYIDGKREISKCSDDERKLILGISRSSDVKKMTDQERCVLLEIALAERVEKGLSFK